MGNLDKLLYWRGVGHEYVNYRGEHVTVSLENRMRLLHAMDVETDTEESINLQVFDLDVKPWQQWLAPMLMVAQGNSSLLEINLPPGLLESNFQYTLTLENGVVIEGDFIPSHFSEVGDYLYEDVHYSRRAIEVKALPLGYHQLQLSLTGQSKESAQQARVVVVPDTAYTPSWIEDGQKPWGIIVQLYTLRSNRNWGIGDFSDLKFLIAQAAKAGANMIGLNPLHALRVPVEYHCSPYSPSDRRFLNPLYIDPEQEPEFQIVTQSGSVSLEATLTKMEAMRKPEQVDYAGVYALKTPVFKSMFAAFRERELNQESERAQAFLSFLAEAGKPLLDYCLYQVLEEHSQGSLESLNDQERAQAAVKYADDMQFQAYLQWVANEQLEACQTYSKDVGMDVGLMRDLAVGADGGGAEVSSNLKLFCRDAAVGAPPDPLAEIGQNWGLPPMDPTVLRDSCFEHFINLLRANMSHCGALRIDHAMALMRLWWCPPGKTADFGSYVYYPFEHMLGLLKLESMRNQCMVIGEDMGIVPPGFREALVGANIFTNKMFYFEKQHHGQFTPPQDYFPRSLAMLTNHDVPTITSWWVGSDLELRESLNLLEEGVNFEDVFAQRATEKHRLLEWLQHLNLVDGEDFDALKQSPMTEALAAIILQGVSQCASQLFVIQLEDLELQESPVNVPGTSDQYANWQRKLGVPLEVLFNDKGVQSLLGKITAQRS